MPQNVPPTEFRIWPFGEIKTTKGTFLFDTSAAKSVLAAWKSYGNRLTIDYEHKAVDPNGRAGDGKSAGSFLLELRDDGLYAVDVRWTPPAFEQLSNKEWLYFSPYFSAEEDTGRILELVNIALTNIPATTHMQPLVAAHRSDSPMDDEDTTKTTKLADGPARPPNDDEEADESEPKADVKARLAKLRAALAEAEKAYASLASSEDDASESVSSEEDEMLASPLAGDDTADEDDDDGEDDPPSKREPATTSRAPARTNAASRVVAAASAATGKTDPAEIVGALTALAKTNARNVSLSKRLAHLERKLQRTEVDALVTRAIKTGRLTPAEREWALEYGMESVAKLRGYLDVTPKRAVLAGHEPREPQRGAAGAATGGPLVALSDVERRICQNTGITPEKFAEVKNRPIRFGES